MFTQTLLLRLCPHADQAILAGAVPVFDARAVEFGLTTPLRVAHFLAQLAHESAGFTKAVENLDYSAGRIAAVWPRLAPRADALAHNPEALANAAYCDRLGNGSEQSGDGWRYRGRGLIQITGKDNYSLFGGICGARLKDEPDLAAAPDIAALVALAFWRSRLCNPKADADSVEAVTRAINGPALEGIVERRALTEKAKALLAEPVTTDLVA